ncbi:Hypothetical protein, putative [Bodo saltans]|uniref:Uncharacterized protein n=1 Tax=Bodo saltans TaxID=75058 RepID=A0A0S4KH01_BODSA|nr:Hypothetical protein, putative [Bodo saltans]|eukprot:CUI14968.1 Hypothetical protein, putative [Bodo saltans]
MGNVCNGGGDAPSPLHPHRGGSPHSALPTPAPDSGFSTFVPLGSLHETSTPLSCRSPPPPLASTPPPKVRSSTSPPDETRSSSSPPRPAVIVTDHIETAWMDNNTQSARLGESEALPSHLFAQHNAGKVDVYEMEEKPPASQRHGGATTHHSAAGGQPQRAADLEGLNVSVNDTWNNNVSNPLDPNSAVMPTAPNTDENMGAPTSGRRRRLSSMQLSGVPSVFHSTVSRHPSWENQPHVNHDATTSAPPPPVVPSPASPQVATLPPHQPPPPVLTGVISPIMMARRVTSSGSARSILVATPTFSASRRHSSSVGNHGPQQACGEADDLGDVFQRKRDEPEDSLELPTPPSGAVVHASRHPHPPQSPSVVYHHAVPSSPIAYKGHFMEEGPFLMSAAHPQPDALDDCSSPLGSIYKFGRRRRSSSRSSSRQSVVHVAPPAGTEDPSHDDDQSQEGGDH